MESRTARVGTRAGDAGGNRRLRIIVPRE